MASDRKSFFSSPFAIISLVLMAFLLIYYLQNCANKTSESVLGVSTFSTGSSKNPVVNGESFNFTTTAVSDSEGLVNATALFDLSGQGVIDNNIHGPGTCAKLTDVTAVCNNVNAEANQTLFWTVPVTPKSNCSQLSPASISFQARLVTPVETSTSATGVNCVASQPAATTNPSATTSPSATTAPGGTGATGTTGTTGTGGAGGGSGAGAGQGSNAGTGGDTGESNASLAQLCSNVAGIPLIFILIALLAGGMFYSYNKNS